MTKSKQRSIIALALLRWATSNEESKQALKVRRTLKIEQRDNSKETRNDFEESSKNYSEMYTKIHQEITDIVSDIFVNERLKLWNWFERSKGCWDTNFREFDPGSGRTLAACLTHASRTELFWKISSEWIWFSLVADGWVTREEPAFQRGTTVGNDC